jgi:hypothetical protein
MLDRHDFLLNLLLEPEMPGAIVTGALRCWAASLDERHAAHDVLINGNKPHLISLSDQPVAQMNCRTTESESPTSSASMLDLVTMFCLPDMAKTGSLAPTTITHPVCDLDDARVVSTPHPLRILLR